MRALLLLFFLFPFFLLLVTCSSVYYGNALLILFQVLHQEGGGVSMINMLELLKPVARVIRAKPHRNHRHTPPPPPPPLRTPWLRVRPGALHLNLFCTANATNNNVDAICPKVVKSH